MNTNEAMRAPGRSLVYRISDGKALTAPIQPAAADLLCSAWNRHLYNRGPYCEVRHGGNAATAMSDH